MALNDIDLSGSTLMVKEVKTGFLTANGSSDKRNITAVGSTLTVRRVAHLGRTMLLDTASGSVVTLPAASGSGDKYKFLVTTTVTSNSHIIKVTNASDTMIGGVITVKTDAAAAGFGEAAATTDDTITFNGTTTGGSAGTWIEATDVATNVWHITGIVTGSGTLAGSVFSATV